MKPLQTKTLQHSVDAVVTYAQNDPRAKKVKDNPPKMKKSLSPENNKPQSALPSQASEYGHLLPAAHGLIEKHADKTRAHLLSTGAVMEALALRFGGDPATWKVAGYLHDLDWDHLEKDAEAHCGTTLEQMLKEIGSPKELLEDVRSHYAEKYGAEHPLDSMLRRCLYCVDELTGFIIAVALVRPSKKLFDVEVKSVKKKFKEKSFAAQVNREQILKCEELLGIPLDEFIAITLDSMKPIAQDLGL
jgi:predicted hydrolase (HD superfamily)